MGKTGVYLEGLFPSRHKRLCQVTMVLDTGNLNQSVMSYKCAKDLGLNIQTTSRTATGVDGTDINCEATDVFVTSLYVLVTKSGIR